VNLLNASEVNIIEPVFDAYDMDGDGEEVGMVMLRLRRSVRFNSNIEEAIVVNYSEIDSRPVGCDQSL
jgi:hypothetical protein